MAPVTFIGPEQQSCPALLEHGYSAIPEPGFTYTLPDELADELVRSSKHWTSAAQKRTATEGRKRRKKPVAATAPSSPTDVAASEPHQEA